MRLLPQISPSNTAIGLTRRGLGTSPGEPAKYFPSGLRHYFRITPNDTVQGGALAAAMRDRRYRRVATLTDGELYGTGVAAWTRYYARRLGLRVVAFGQINRNWANYRSVARRMVRVRADCVLYAGITANNAVQLFKDLAAALPRARLFGSDGVAESGFTDPRDGGVPPSVAKRIFITVAVRAENAYPASGGQVFEHYRSRYGDPYPDPYALHGYEAMR
jgi:branched-chain amino acid transport system substrate-binding protein